MINQHTSNCVSKVGIQISTTHQDNILKNLLKQLEKSVSNNNKMCTLTTNIALNSNFASGDLPHNLLKFWSEYKGEAVPAICSVCVTNEDDNFTRAT